MTASLRAGIIGQEEALSVLERALTQNRWPGTYLFVGPSGVGKERIALQLAISSIGEAAEKRIRAGNHPDVRIFRPRDDGRRNLKVQTVREEILPHAISAPFEAQRSFIILPEVDVSLPLSAPAAANALLKTLEEPRAGVTFILLSERPERLLPTIRSRSQLVRFERLNDVELRELLEREGIAEGPERDAAIALSRGRADRAIGLATDGLGESLFALAKEVDAAAAGNRPRKLLDAADTLANHEHGELALECLQTYFRDLTVLAAGGDSSMTRFQAPSMVARAQSEPAAAFAARGAMIEDTRRELEANAQPLLAMERLVFRLRSGVRERSETL